RSTPSSGSRPPRRIGNIDGWTAAGWTETSNPASESGGRLTAKPSCGTEPSGLAQQEVQGRGVERLGVLVEGGVRKVVKDDQLAACDPALQGAGEPCGRAQ